MTKAELAGENAPDMLALRVVLELTAVTYAVSFAGQVADRGTYVLSGESLTLTGTAGPNQGRTIPFTTKPGVQHYLATYRRKS
jgi:hypothetical protein